MPDVSVSTRSLPPGDTCITPCPPQLPVAPRQERFPILMGCLLTFSPSFPGVLEESFAKCTACMWAQLTQGAALGSAVLRVEGMWCCYTELPWAAP